MGTNASNLRNAEEFSLSNRAAVPRLSGRSHRSLPTENRHDHLFDVVIQLKHEDKDIYSCFFPSDDDSVLLTASKVEQTTFLRHNREFSSIRLWDLNRRQINTGFLADFPRSFRSCDFSPDGQLVVCIFSEDSLALVRMRSWKTTSAEVVHMRRFWRKRRGVLMCCAFSPDGRSLVVASKLTGDLNHICIIDIATKKMVRKMKSATNSSSKIRGHARSCVFSPDGLFLAVSCTSGQLIVFDTQDFHIHSSLDLDSSTSSTCLCLPFRHTSRRSLSSHLQCWYLFDPRYGHKYLTSCLEDGTIQTWSLAADEPGLTCIQFAYALQTPWQKIRSAAFSPDGTMLAVGTSDSKVLALNSESLHVLFVLNAHQQPDGLRTWYQNTEVSCLAFTRTCQQIAAGYKDGRIRVWQLPLILNLQHMCRLVVINHVPAREIPQLPLPAHLIRLHINDEQLKRRMLMAVPKKGRLYDQCIGMLERAGIKYRKKARLDLALCTSLNMALVFLPAADIALYVSQGRIDLGITGKDVVAESGGEVHELLKLGFGKCKLAVQAAVASNITSAEELVGKRIVTSFPNVTRKYFAQFDPDNTTKINYVSGSVEVACSLGVADGIVDLVETGDTMRAAGLEVVSEILQSEAVLIANPNTHFQDVVKTVKSRLEGIISANKYVMVEFNVERTNLAKALKITPGKRSATLSPLDDNDWVAVQSMILQQEENHILDKLVEIGAHDIVTFNIQNCRV